MALWQTFSAFFRFSGATFIRAAEGEARAIPVGDTLIEVRPRLSLQDQFGKIRGKVETGMARAERVQRAHATARERLDATELSLRRMLAEIEEIMPVPPFASLEAPANHGVARRPRIALAA